MGDDFAEKENAVSRGLKSSGNNSVGGFDFIGKGVVNEDGHAYLLFVDPAPESLEISIEIVEAGVDFSQSAEDTAFVYLAGIAVGGPFVVAIEIILEAAAVAVVKTRTDELVRVFDIGGAAEAEFFEGVESG